MKKKQKGTQKCGVKNINKKCLVLQQKRKEKNLLFVFLFLEETK